MTRLIIMLPTENVNHIDMTAVPNLPKYARVVPMSVCTVHVGTERAVWHGMTLMASMTC